MNPKEYVYCALDFSDLNKTINFTNKIYKHVGGVKIGLEFFVKYGLEGVIKIKNFGIPIFLDLKLNDIPNTVKKATENLISLNPKFLTVHLNGGSNMIKEVCKIKKKVKILGVSLLTSLDQKDLIQMGVGINFSDFVLKLTNIGVKSGIDGIVSSPNEVKKLSNKFKKKLIYVTPGIRLDEKNDDQKRVSSPGEAIKNGSSIIVIGRPITMSRQPIKVINKIKDSIRDKIEG